MQTKFEISKIKLTEALVEYLDGREMDFIDMVWEGNVYTGHGSEYPKLDKSSLENILYRFFTEFVNDKI